ncbi:diacylglycerol/lipid kinase family protein [Metabacillus litoralis]|uniref:diacylglycerol/lipid kinase family protein n=1 Tax=Metabacillus litoralis TaxID=152268 RepID=UPI001CFDA309|nr:YegS/Rv2252/BmrU family lipid kinase [Metabacillus litoralis]
MKSFNKALLLYNGYAGQEEIEKSLGVCTSIFSSSVEELIIRKTKKKDDTKNLSHKYGPDVDLIILLGGDGTLHDCINGISSSSNRPVIAPIPTGTCNDFSRSLMISQNIRKASEDLLKGKIELIDGVKVNQNYFINFCGVGLITEASKNITNKQKNFLGTASYIISAVKSLSHSEPFSFTLKIDGEKIAGQALMILVANGRFLGTNELPFKNSNLKDGLGEIYIIKKADLSALKDAFRIKTDRDQSKNIDTSAITFMQGSTIKLETEQSLPVDTDGEIHMKTPLSISFLQKHYQFLVPNTEGM